MRDTCLFLRSQRHVVKTVVIIRHHIAVIYDNQQSHTHKPLCSDLVTYFDGRWSSTNSGDLSASTAVQNGRPEVKLYIRGNRYNLPI
jgi:hypothetical protein